MSPPVQKNRPFARMTTARSARSTASSAAIAPRRSSIGSVRALPLSGRFSQISAQVTSPRCRRSRKTSCSMFIHPSIQGPSAHRLQALAAGPEHHVGVFFPPAITREDLDFNETVETRGLHQRPKAPEIDNPVAHHAPVEQGVLRLPQPVADMKRPDPVPGGDD